ncbi:hypothetical protein BB561_004326 [Smittium simulii]|uniref:UEV domain-containing protein n=1 Tax=Smittium simulii TaxID=133385 RepID=A0A2T9YH27_9FUNG|nr:hypothetical protein BB561_004326 [Smittium simulii]
MSTDSDQLNKWLSDISKNMLASPKRGSNLIEHALTTWLSLLPRVEEYIFPNGTRQSLLNLYGTIPVNFMNSTFNIPVSIWFTRDFPKKPPHFYVTPTPDMVLKKSTNVKKRGRVITSYIEQWDKDDKDMTLFSLINQVISIFSQQPPVFAKPPNYISGGDSDSDTENAQNSIDLVPTLKKENVSKPQTNIDIAGTSVIKNNDKHALPSSTIDIIKTIESMKMSNNTKPINLKVNMSDSVSATNSNGLAPQSLPANSASINTPLKFKPQPHKPTKLNDSSASLNSNSQINSNSLKSDYVLPTTGNNTKIFTDEADGHNVASIDLADPNPQASPMHQLPSIPLDSSKIQKNNSFANAMAKDILENQNFSSSLPNSQQFYAVKAENSLQSSLLDSEIPNDDEKRLLGYKVAIVDKLGETMYEFRELHSKLNHNLLKDCSELHSCAAIASLEEKELQNLNKNLDKNISILSSSVQKLKENKENINNILLQIKNEDIEQLEPENLFSGADIISEQCIKVSSEIHAIEDAFYYLGKFLDNGQIELSIYLKHVRKLAQKLFFAKALQNKIINTLNL